MSSSVEAKAEGERSTTQGTKGAEESFSLAPDTRRAAIGGGIAALVALSGMLVINLSSGSEARLLLEGMLPSIRFLCSAVMTASATILALMLTLLSFSQAYDQKLKARHYERVRQIARADSATFAAALVLLLLVSIPLADTSEVPANWYTIVFYSAVLYSAGLGGALLTVMLMLYNAIIDLITLVHPGKESQLLIEGD